MSYSSTEYLECVANIGWCSQLLELRFDIRKFRKLSQGWQLDYRISYESSSFFQKIVQRGFHLLPSWLIERLPPLNNGGKSTLKHQFNVFIVKISKHGLPRRKC